jgi:hypothetical protein
MSISGIVSFKINNNNNNNNTNSQQSQASLHHHREFLKLYEVERRVCDNLENENNLYNTISTIHGGYYFTQITPRFKNA